MFYTQFLFQKKGALAHVWIAAHWERRLKKPQIMTVDIVKAAGQISNPAVAMALRLSGQLLLGLVRIYQKKVDFLHSDVVDARLKLQQMGRASQKKKLIDDPGVVANPGQITIDEGEGPIDELEWKTVDEVLENMSIDDGLSDITMTTTPAKPRLHALHTAPAAQLTLQGQEHVIVDPATDHHQPGVTLADFEEIDLFAGLADEPDPMRDQQAASGKDDKKGEAMDETKDGDEVARGVEQKQDDQNPLLAGADIPVDFPVDDVPLNASGVGDIKLEPPSQPGDAMNTDADKLPASQQQQSQKDKKAGKDGKEKDKKQDKGKQQEVDMDESFRAPKGRKRKLLQEHDEKTELSSHEIKQNLQDTTPIVGRREFVPLSKRQKLQHDEKEPEGNLEDMFFQPAFGLGLASGANFGAAVMSPMRGGGVPGLLSPALRATFDRVMRDDDGKGDALPVDPAIASSQQRLADIGEQLGVDPNNLLMEPEADLAAAGDQKDDQNMMQDLPADPVDQPPIDGSVPEAPFAGSKSPAKAPAEAGSAFLGGDIDQDVEILARMAEKDAAALKEVHDYFHEKGDEDEETKEGSQAAKEGSEGSAGRRLGFGWSKRTDKMVAVLNKDFRELEKKEKRKSGAGSAAPATLNLNDMLNGRGRRVAAGVFYQMLVLKGLDYVNVQQDAYTEDNPFPPILITRSEAFEVSRSQSVN